MSSAKKDEEEMKEKKNNDNDGDKDKDKKQEEKKEEEKKEEKKEPPKPAAPPPAPAPPKPEPPLIFEHTSEMVSWWDAWNLMLCSIVVIILPLRIGFFLTSVEEWLALDLVADVSHIIDMIIRTRRTYTEHGELIRDPEKIREQYFGSNEFILDVVSILPIDLGSIALPQFRALFLCNRLFRMHRVWDALANWEMVTKFKPSLVSMVKSLIYFYYVVHVDACIKHLILYLENNDAEVRWISTTGFLQRSFWDRYYRALYLSLVAASGFNSSTPTTPVECVVSIFDCVFSIAVFGVIIGLFANLIANLDAAKIFFFHQLDEAHEYMRTQKLSKELVDSVNDYYSYLWSSGQALEKNEVLQKLPASIRHNIAFHVTSSFIRKVPFFKDITKEEFFIEICKNLLPRTALPATYIVKKGEMGTEMFFVLRGELNVVLDNGKVVFTFTTGGFFGEIAIMYQTKRTATIIARTYCDMFVLGKADFSKVLKKFPLESKTIRNIAKERFEAISAGEKEKAEADKKRREDELRAATQRAEMAAALNAAIENEGEQYSSQGDSDDDDDEEEYEDDENESNATEDDHPLLRKGSKINNPRSSGTAEMLLKNAAQGLLKKVAEDERKKRHEEEDKAFEAKYGSSNVTFDEKGFPIQPQPQHPSPKPSAAAASSATNENNNNNTSEDQEREREEAAAALPHSTVTPLENRNISAATNSVFVESVRDNLRDE